MMLWNRKALRCWAWKMESKFGSLIRSFNSFGTCDGIPKEITIYLDAHFGMIILWNFHAWIKIIFVIAGLSQLRNFFGCMRTCFQLMSYLAVEISSPLQLLGSLHFEISSLLVPCTNVCFSVAPLSPLWNLLACFYNIFHFFRLSQLSNFLTALKIIHNKCYQ